MKVLDSFSLKGKTALMTGPEGPYGAAIAEALADAGAKLFIASKNSSAAKSAAAALKGYDVTAVSYNPLDEKTIVSMVDTVTSKGGRIDIYVDNSTNSFTTGWDAPSDALLLSLKENQTGTMVTMRAVGDAMKAAGTPGSVVFISSVYGMVGPDVQTLSDDAQFHKLFSLDYAFIKGGYVNYCRQVSSFMGQFGGRANTICITPPPDGQPDSYISEMCRLTTLHRMPTLDDIKGAVVFLASDASGYVAGNTLLVDGGYVAK